MGLKCGIVGLPNSGKSTLFNALTGAGVRMDTFPFTTVDPNVGVVEVPDQRLKKIAELVRTPKVTPATVHFVDIAGLVKGASEGEGLGNAFLSHIRGTDLIVHVVRCFADEDIPHLMGQPNPHRDIEVIELELFSSDLEVVERRLEKVEVLVRKGVKDVSHEVDVLRALRDHLSRGERPPQEVIRELPSDLHIITALPVIFVANVSGKDEEAQWVESLSDEAQRRDAPLVTINAKLEWELSDMEPEERKEFMAAYEIPFSGVEELSGAAYKLLDLITFYTHAGGKELRAWPVKRGTTAVKGAGMIHSDFEKGFIRAEVIAYNDFISAGGEHGAREKGFVKTVGRDYLIQDGDIITFKTR